MIFPFVLNLTCGACIVVWLGCSSWKEFCRLRKLAQCFYILANAGTTQLNKIESIWLWSVMTWITESIAGTPQMKAFLHYCGDKEMSLLNIFEIYCRLQFTRCPGFLCTGFCWGRAAGVTSVRRHRGYPMADRATFQLLRNRPSALLWHPCYNIFKMGWKTLHRSRERQE